jgi:hypothetical protein
VCCAADNSPERQSFFEMKGSVQERTELKKYLIGRMTEMMTQGKEMTREMKWNRSSKKSTK